MLGVLASDYGPDIISAVDVAWEHSYFPVIAPVKDAVNILRLVLSACLGVYNLVVGILGAPLWGALRTVSECAQPRSFASNFLDLGLAASNAALGAVKYIAGSPLRTRGRLSARTRHRAGAPRSRTCRRAHTHGA